MLRIYFTADDLARTKIIGGPDPMWELLLSLNRLRRGDGPAFGDWRRRARAKVPATTRLLSDLAPATGYAVDFLTPVTKTPSLDLALETLRSTPHQQVRTDLARLAAERALPAWATELAEGGADGLAKLAGAAKNYFDACLAPYWHHVHAHVDNERARLARLAAEAGYEQVLSRLHPSARWRYPVLELDYPVERELHLAGRGLLLVPAFFCHGLPITFRDGDLRPTLVVPIDRDGTRSTGQSLGESRSLVTLLGRTRAKVLETINIGGCTTSELARRAGVSLATASQQASVLRQARLVTSKQHGQAVLHSITPLGRALLDS